MRSLETAQHDKLFYVEGWMIDRTPAVLHGVSWARLMRQPEDFCAAIEALEAGEKRSLPFRTSAGEETSYTVKRVR